MLFFFSINMPKSNYYFLFFFCSNYCFPISFFESSLFFQNFNQQKKSYQIFFLSNIKSYQIHKWNSSQYWEWKKSNKKKNELKLTLQHFRLRHQAVILIHAHVHFRTKNLNRSQWSKNQENNLCPMNLRTTSTGLAAERITLPPNDRVTHAVKKKTKSRCERGI